MFLLGVLSFNLFHINEKLQLIQVVNEFHSAQINNDKKLINNLLTDTFIESGVKLAVATPDAIYKNDIENFDNSKVNLTIEAKYLILLNVLSNNNMSLSFVRKSTVLPESGATPFSIYFYVTYTFEKTAENIKISKIERKL
jgi:hypothetical protein